MKRSSFQRIGFLIAVTLLAAALQAENRKKPLQGTPAERLLALASKTTTIDVIVGIELDEQWTPDGRFSSERKNRQRTHIREKKDEMLRRHPRAKLRANRDYASIPYLVLEVDEHVLRELMDDVQVTSIEENAHGEITLAESTLIIGATVAHARGYRGNGQHIVIIDTGVDRNHPFLSGRVVGAEEACFSGFGRADSACPNGLDTQFGIGAGAPCPIVDANHTCDHGTHVAGIAAGRNFNTGYNGVAPDAWIIPIQVTSWQSCTTGHNCGADITETDVVAALDYVNTTLLASHPVAAVSISLRFFPLQPSRAACDLAAPAFRDIIAALRSNGVAVVVGAGNEGLSQPASLGRIGIPACVTGAISVGATQDDDTVAPYSNTGTFLDFFAPGGATNTAGLMIWSSIPGGGYAEKSGTSMATPHVSGSFAVLRGRSPLASVDKLQNDLVQSGAPITDSRVSPAVVKPRINVNAALDLADVIPPTDPGSFTASGSSSGAVTLTWAASTDNVAVDHYELRRRNRYNAGWTLLDNVTGSPYIDAGNASKMYEYSIVAVDSSGLQSNFKYDYAVNVTFTNDPLSAGSTIVYGRHMAELRQATDAWREFANLTRIFTYAPETNGILAAHFVGPSGVVDAMNAARSQMSLPAFAYSSVPAPGVGVAIRTQHVQQLRTAAR